MKPDKSLIAAVRPVETDVRSQAADPPKARTIRSYVLRQGRITAAQMRAHRELYCKHGIGYREEMLDLDREFGRDAPKILDIGFGMGEKTAQNARENPDIDYLAVEVYTPGVGSLLQRIEREGIRNIKIIRHDVVDVLLHMIRPGALSGVHVFFPDPWPKKRHHKRRLVNREFVELCRDRLASGGYIHLATDWQDYAECIREIFAHDAGFAVKRARNSPATKFAAKGKQAGRDIFDMVFTKR
jgi:tRNA (guanine-N7-)-methyltransferase